MDQQQPSAPRRNIPVFRNDPILVLILGFITCGLYLIYWNIKTAEVINAMVGREAIPLLVASSRAVASPSTSSSTIWWERTSTRSPRSSATKA